MGNVKYRPSLTRSGIVAIDKYVKRCIILSVFTLLLEGSMKIFMYLGEFVLVVGAILLYISTRKPKAPSSIFDGHLCIIEEINRGFGNITPTKQYVLPMEHACVRDAMTALRQGREQVAIRFKARSQDMSRLGAGVTTRLAAMESDTEWGAVIHSALCTFNKDIVDSAMYHLGYKRYLNM